MRKILFFLLFTMVSKTALAEQTAFYASEPRGRYRPASRIWGIFDSQTHKVRLLIATDGEPLFEIEGPCDPTRLGKVNPSTEAVLYTFEYCKIEKISHRMSKVYAKTLEDHFSFSVVKFASGEFAVRVPWTVNKSDPGAWDCNYGPPNCTLDVNLLDTFIGPANPQASEQCLALKNSIETKGIHLSFGLLAQNVIDIGDSENSTTRLDLVATNVQDTCRAGGWDPHSIKFSGGFLSLSDRKWRAPYEVYAELDQSLVAANRWKLRLRTPVLHAKIVDAVLAPLGLSSFRWEGKSATEYGRLFLENLGDFAVAPKSVGLSGDCPSEKSICWQSPYLDDEKAFIGTARKANGDTYEIRTQMYPRISAEPR